MVDTPEREITELIGSRLGARAVAPVVSAPQPEENAEEKFEFDGEFQTRIAALVCRDEEFVKRCGHLIDPRFFENIGEAAVVNCAMRYYRKYGRVPTGLPVWKQLFADDIAAKIISPDVKRLVGPAFANLMKTSLADRGYIEEKVAEFACNQAMTQAIWNSLDLLKRRDFSGIKKSVVRALEVGVNVDGDAYDYFQRIAERTDLRLDKVSGKLPPRGITTGLPQFDDLLYHRGWGRKELATIMGGAKMGKTTALIGFAKAASLAGHNVLYVTLEVASSIIAERLDASITDTEIRQLESHIHDVRSKVEALQKRAGKLILHEYPSGTFTPNMLRALIERYKAKGVLFDLLVVDYADIMAPNHRYNDPIENSKSIYIDLRAICVEENLAGLTATQTNREGFKSTVAKAEHVAEDFNKVRTVDLMISINVTEEERARNEARLYFAASRNQESGFTIFVKQDKARMKFIESILRVE